MEELIEVVKSEQENEIIHVDRIIEKVRFLDREDEKDVGTLIDILQNEDDDYLRSVAAIALGEIENKKAIDPLIQAFIADEGSRVRRSAALALGNIKDERAVGTLIPSLMTEVDWPVRSDIAWALGEIRDKRAVEPLIRSLGNDNLSAVNFDKNPAPPFLHFSITASMHSYRRSSSCTLHRCSVRLHCLGAHLKAIPRLRLLTVSCSLRRHIRITTTADHGASLLPPSVPFT